MYKVKIKTPNPHNKGGLLREMTHDERAKWLANIVTSKYDPHQSKREKDRRIKRDMF